MPDLATTISVSADDLLELYKWVKEQGFFDKLKGILQKKHKFLVLGSTGVGKTNLLESLKHNIPMDIDRMIRTDYARTEKLKIRKQLFQFVDTPGEMLRTSRKDEIRRALKGITGIINVVSYGFHEHRTGGKTEALTRENKPKELWLQQHRRLEIDMLGEWVELLGDPRTSGGLITVVTKADLWWDKEREVRACYETGPYFQALGSAQNLDPVVVSYCSIIKRFWDAGLVSGAFDDLQRLRLRYQLIEALLALAARGRP